MANLAKPTIFGSISQWVRYNFYTKKFNTVPGYILIGLIGAAIALSGALVDSRIPILIAIGLAGILFVIAVLYYPLLGFYTSLVASAFLTMPDRLLTTPIPVPLGTVIELIEYLTLLSIIAKQYRRRVDLSPFWRSPLTILFLVLLIYYISDIFNPVPHSSMGWFNYVRKQFSFFTFYYMTYALMDSYKEIVRFLKIWLALCLFIALYTIKQQWFGLFAFETNWLYRNPEVYSLSFQAGFLRKTSVLSDAATLGVLCASMVLFCVVLAVRTSSKKRQRLFGGFAFAFFLAASYSGTRSSNLMIVLGLVSYALFTLNEKRTYTIITAITLAGLFILFGPFKNNPVVLRVSSTFEGNKDASAMVRSINRHRVQPYLQEHPMGGGIYSCGVEGAAYNEGHYLSKFPPDSGFMKILAEQGWIGLFLTLTFYFIFMRTGIRGFFHSVDPKIKDLYLALTIFLFSLLVGQFSQIALSQYPEVLFYYGALTILYKLKDYDTSNPGTTDNTKTAA